MRIPLDHPFQPGVRVVLAEGNGRSKNWSEGVVDKSYATGHFTLKGSKQRWRPIDFNISGVWRAFRTGSHWINCEARVWDDSDPEMFAAIARDRRRKRFQAIRSRLEAIDGSKVNDAFLDALETALADIAKAEGRTE